MIKFWKSAAKGKSGCPVRPPEANSSTNERIKTLLNNHVEEENQDNLQIFDKKSKLSLSLHDILFDKKALQYFVQFMESIEKQTLIRSWIDIEHFKTCIRKRNLQTEIETHGKIYRASSLDAGYNNHSYDHKKMQIQNWKDNSSLIHDANNLQSSIESSTSLCGNLDKQRHAQENVECTNPTEEALKLFKKYVALEAPHQLDIPDSNRKTIISNICHPEGQINEDCFKPVQDVIYSQIENSYFNDFINSPFYIKAQIDILTNCHLNVKDILNNESILFYFTEYLEQESCRILLEFLMAVMHFRDNLTNSTYKQTDYAQEDAIVLYEKYFSLQATNPVGFPTDIRLRIESEICREEGPLPTCFDQPYQIVFRTLNEYVKSFLESELYYKYLSEMINSVDQMWTSHYKSHSDCSSEFSISTQNTLLAMGDPSFRKKKRHQSVPDMTIDSNQLYNADSLWQRNRYEGLSLGRVNSLGRFESKFEPDPDKKSKSVLRKMVSKFVPANTSKVEEEMAWQIAHMIVKDVTDLTMAPPENEHHDI